MSRNNTGNPIGSGSPLDREDNTKNFDEAVNSSSTTWTDRFGVARPTVSSAADPTGLVQEAVNASVAAQGALDSSTRIRNEVFAISMSAPFAWNPVLNMTDIAACWDATDLLALYKDAAGTEPCTAVDDEVRRIEDLSGSGNHLTILSDASPGILRRTQWGRWYVHVPSGSGFRTASDKALGGDTYLCIATALHQAAANTIFGLMSTTNRHVAMRGASVQNRIYGWATDSLGIADPGSAYEGAPLAAPLVADALLSDGFYDLRINTGFRDTAANPHVSSFVGDGITNAVFGVNMASNSAASAMKQDFFGGLVLRRDPGIDRDKIVEFFRQKTDRPAQVDDNVLLVIGDSTGDGRPGSVNGPIEWPHLLAERIAASDPTAYVEIRLYSEAWFTYGPTVVIQQGSGGPSWTIYNGSVSGRTPQFITGQHFRTLVENVPPPAVVIWNHGHNISATSGATVSSFKGRFMGAMEQVRMRWPGAMHWAILQNPWMTSTSMGPVVAELAALAAIYGDMPTADVHQAYLDYDPPKDPSLYRDGIDNVHPSAFAMTDIWMPLIGAMFDANWPRSAGRPAFVASKSVNLLKNGDFSQWDSDLPNGWTKTGDGTVALNAARRDADSLYSALITNGSTATSLQQSLDATPYQGATMTLAVRQFIETGAADQTAGQIRLSANGTGTPAVSNFAGLTNQGTGGWRWMIASLPVPANATVVTVDLFAAGVSGADKGSSSYGSCVLVSGDRPRRST